MPLSVNVVSVPEDEDFINFSKMCDDDSGWTVALSKSKVKIFTKDTSATTFKMLKARAQYPDVPASTVYDVLQDPDYRRTWDKYMLEGVDIGILNPNNDICYYGLKSPSPFRNRDFVLQRSWLETPKEMMIFNHSVCHEAYPPRKGVVRATSHLTGYHIRPIDSTSCVVHYIAQSDPGGVLPSWVVNRLATVISPKAIKKLHRACLNYPSWKKKNNEFYKPWLYAEQLLSMPRVDINKCVPKVYQQEFIDESQVSANDIAVEDQVIENGNSND